MSVPGKTETLPLEGVVVLDFSHLMQGPWATEMLGDLGVEVIKIEPVTGGERGRQSGTNFIAGHSAQFLAMNRNKRSIAVDLKSVAGREIARRLIQQADVLVQNFRPGAMDRLGLGVEDVSELNPRLIYCSASGYGADIPDPRKAGQDLLAQARTGAMWLTGRVSDPPTPTGLFVADIHAATMLAMGVIAALYQRDRTGTGTHLEVDLIGAMLHQMTQEVVAARNSRTLPERGPIASSPFLEAPYGVYECADGWIALSLSPVIELAEALERPDIATRFPTKESAILGGDVRVELVAEAIRTYTVDRCVAILDRAGVWCAPVNDFTTMVDDPYVAWSRRSVRVRHPDAGEVELVQNPLRFHGSPLPIRYAPPLLGQHTDEVLADVGYDATHRDVLYDAGVIGCEMTITIGSET